MADTGIRRVLQHLCQVAARQATEGVPDEQLLERFALNRDEEAFTAIVHRHGPMVIGVCRRQLREMHDVEDAFQATFLVLARKAASIRRGESLSSWLHGVAVRVARKIRIEALRRARRERQRPAPTAVEAGDALTWGELRAVLDEELGRLSTPMRAPLILCYLEGRTQDEAATRLGWSKSTLRRRLDRGRRLLQSRLARRGLTLSATLCVPLLSDPAAAAALPIAFTTATVKAAIRFGARDWTGIALRAKTITLAESVLKSMALAQCKLAAVTLLTVSLMAITGLGVYQAIAQNEAQALTAFGLTDTTADAPRKPDMDKAAPVTRRDNLHVLIIGGICQDEECKPLAGVQVALYRDNHVEGKAERLHAAATDAAGRFLFGDLPPPPSEIDHRTWGYSLVLTKEGRASILRPVCPDYPMDRLQFYLRPAATIQGRVADENGKPIAGARVWSQSLITGPVEGICCARSDAFGRYAIKDMAIWGVDVRQPTKAGDHIYKSVTACFLDVLHPEYGHKRPMYRYLPATVDVVLQPAAVIEGKVIDQVTGKPAAGVLVCMQGIDPTQGGGWQQPRTDSSGKYRLPALSAGAYNVWAEAPDRACEALDSFTVEAGKKYTAPDLLLVEGGWIEGRVIDAATNKPVGGGKESRLWVGLYGPSRPKSGAACQSSLVDQHGRFRLHVAPGINFPYLMSSDYWQRTQRREFFEKGIEVKSGEVVSVVFRVLPKKPVADRQR